MTELISIVFLFIALLILLGIVILVYIHFYQIVNEPKVQKRMRRLRKSVQPWVTVLVYARHNDTGIDASVKALLKSYYHNFDIVIVKDSSRNALAALNKGYKKSQRGEVVMSLRAGTIVPPSFIKRAVALKAERQKLHLHTNERVSLKTFVEIIHSLETMFWYRANNIYLGTPKNIATIKKRLPLEFMMVFIFLLIIATSFILQEPIIIWYSWLLVTGYLFSIIWLSSETEKTKLQLSFSAISALFLLPVASIVMRFSQFHSRN